MINALYSPSLLFIRAEEWHQQSSRDRFLAHLLDHLNWTDKLGCIAVLWSDECEALLWTDPQMPPWRLDRDWRLRLVPIIYNLLVKHRVLLETGTLTDVEVTPDIVLFCESDSVRNAFLNLMHAAKSLDACFICTGGTSSRSLRDVSVECGCHATSTLKVVERGVDWTHVLDLVELLWPKNRNDLHDFERLVHFTLAQQEALSRVHNRLCLSTQFVADIMKEHKLRKQIVSSICARLICTQQQAGEHAGLQDEGLYGQPGMRRFRVTQAARIHYSFDAAHEIRLLAYYGEGQHDDGL